MRGLSLLCLALCSLAAREAAIPSGASGQLQFTLYRPAAFGSAVLMADLDPAVFAEIISGSAFSAMGDAAGYVSIDKLHVEVHVWSRLKGIGRVARQPIVVVNARTLPGLANGTRVVVNAQIAASDSTIGTALSPVAFDTDAVTVTGMLSISNVRPDSISTIRVHGTGFGSGTSVEIQGAVVSGVNVISETDIAVTLGGAAEMVGKRVRVRNADGSTVDFYPSASVGAPDAANRLPIFPLQQLRYATADYIRLLSGTVFLHNSTESTVDAQVVATGTLRDVLQVTSVSLRPGESWSGVTTDLGAYASSSYLYVYTSAPLLMLQLMHVNSIYSNPGVYDYAAPLSQVEAPLLAFDDPAQSVSWIWPTGTVLPEPRTVQFTGAVGLPNFTFQLAKSGGDWFTASTSSNVVCLKYDNCAANEVTVRADPSGLAPGIYRGTVTITPTATEILPDVFPMVIPVALTVTASPSAKTTVGYMIFTQPGGILTQTETVRSDIVPGAFTVSVLTGGDGNWLTATPGSGTSPAAVTVTANPAGLAPGTYSGHVVIQGSGNAQIIETLLFVYSGLRLQTDDIYLRFGGSGTQVVSVRPDCQVSGCRATLPTSVPFTASQTTNSIDSWLSVTTGSDRIIVRTFAEGLKPGNYTGSVTVRSPDLPGPMEIPVVLTVPDVRAPALQASPASVHLSGVPGGVGSGSYVCVSSGFTPTSYTARALTKDGGDWLRVDLLKALTNTCGLTVSADPSELQTGLYTGEVIVNATGQTLSVPVALRVVEASPTSPVIGAVVNAASMRTGSVSAGEIVTIFGSGLGSNVLLDGVSAQLLYVSDQQINAVIPPATQGHTAIKLNVGSASWTVPVTSAAPGVFRVLNQDNTLNSASNPAARGSVIQIFGTGFNSEHTTVTLGGKPAQTLFAGQAPGAVAGLFQINVTLPVHVSFGDAVPLLIQASSVTTEVSVAIAN